MHFLAQVMNKYVMHIICTLYKTEMCEDEIGFLYIQFSSWISPLQQRLETCTWPSESSALLFFEFQTLM